MHMKKYFLFALLAMFIVGCDSPNVYYPSGGNVTEMSFLSFLTVSETDRNDNLRRFVIKNEALIIREKGF